MLLYLYTFWSCSLFLNFTKLFKTISCQGLIEINSEIKKNCFLSFTAKTDRVWKLFRNKRRIKIKNLENFIRMSVRNIFKNRPYFREADAYGRSDRVLPEYKKKMLQEKKKKKTIAASVSQDGKSDKESLFEFP